MCLNYILYCLSCPLFCNERFFPLLFVRHRLNKHLVKCQYVIHAHEIQRCERAVTSGSGKEKKYTSQRLTPPPFLHLLAVFPSDLAPYEETLAISLAFKTVRSGRRGLHFAHSSVSHSTMADGTVAALVAPIINSKGLHYKNPRFPLNIKLPDNLECGTKIYVHGSVGNDADRFALNLKNAEKDANTFFHFNPRFDEGCVVRNSRLDEAWGDEERDGDNPFIPGEPFLISVAANVDGYQVEVNGSPFCTYGHRDGMPLCDVTHITMNGDVTVYGVHIPLSSMPIPLVLRVPKNTFLGDMVVIKGELPGDSDRFAVNLQCGTDEGADIMYHFNPRLGDNLLVCNNRCADSWGEEQRLEGLPVAPGDQFTLCIVAAKDGYQPIINGNPLPLFPHRLDMSAACSIVIDGDVRVLDLTVDCPPVRLPPHVPDINLEEFEDKTLQAFYPTNPVTMKVPDGFGPGKMVYVSGKIDENPSRFKVNLQCAESDDSEIALHFNPRWDSDGGPVLVLNSLDDGAWGEEIREPNFMAPGTEIQLYILCTEEGYCVMLDGNPAVACFPHRMDTGRVSHIAVDGSLNVSRIMAI